MAFGHLCVMLGRAPGGHRDAEVAFGNDKAVRRQGVVSSYEQ